MTIQLHIAALGIYRHDGSAHLSLVTKHYRYLVDISGLPHGHKYRIILAGIELKHFLGLGHCHALVHPACVSQQLPALRSLWWLWLLASCLLLRLGSSSCIFAVPSKARCKVAQYKYSIVDSGFAVYLGRALLLSLFPTAVHKTKNGCNKQ